MHFIGLRTRNLGTATRQMENPFTRGPITHYIDDGMTPAESAASSEVLRDATASEPDDDLFRTVQISGDTYACVRLGQVGGEIHVEGGLTPDVASFIYRLALAAGMLVTSTIDPDVVAVLPGQGHAGIEARWPGTAHVDSARSLLLWIQKELSNGRMA